MTEKWEEVKTFRVTKHCSCGGEMFFTGKALPVHPLLFEHQCEECFVEQNFTVQYPRLVYKEIEV